MSEMIIVQCDHGDGECNVRFEGFAMNAVEGFRQQYLHLEGWLIRDDKHYCPLHKDEHDD